MVYSSSPNFALIVTYCRPCEAKYRHNTAFFLQNFRIWAFCTQPSLDHGQMWRTTAYPWCTLLRQISPSSLYTVNPVRQRAVFDQIFNFGGLQYPFPSPIRAKFGMHPRCTLTCHIYPDQFTASSVTGKISNFSAFSISNLLWWRHLAA